MRKNRKSRPLGRSKREPLISEELVISGEGGAEVLITEIGPDRTPFPSDAHLASWAGLSPGNNESADRKRSGKTTKGSRWLRQALVQAAWAASHKMESYFQQHARNLMHRRGRKSGLVAVAHALPIIIYPMLKEGSAYRDLGPHFLDQLRATHMIRFHVRKLQNLGLQVTYTRGSMNFQGRSFASLRSGSE